ncbi:Acetolactate synthase small subunit [hydrothermal vent metagenome]|uniref:Acetolactate synthase small subunit n=1 Tax=hydrothermal vent metagenome TaxID=652676 RepID=A0A3B1E6Y6_9ZZZZ
MNNFNDFYNTEERREVLSVIVINKDSVLSRIVDLFSARGYNIDSLTVAPVSNTEYSRITIITIGSARTIDQIVKQLNKLVPVLKVTEHKDVIEKDTVLIKIPLDQSLSDVDVLARAYNGAIQNVTKDAIVVSATDEPKRIANFIKVIEKYKPLEIVRSGVVAMER